MKKKTSKTAGNVLVTGGAVRIGDAICRKFADKGYGVIVHYRKSGREAGALVKEIKNAGGLAWAVSGRVDTQAGCRKIIAKAWSVSGGFSVLVNNASIFEMGGLADADWSGLRRNFDANLFGPVTLAVEFQKRVMTAGISGGCVVNLLDRRITSNDSDASAYVLSKKALAEFTRMAAVEFAPAIRVNAVAPGAILPAKGLKVIKSKGEFRKNPLGLKVSAGEVASSVLYLAEALPVTGQIIFADGGRHLNAKG